MDHLVVAQGIDAIAVVAFDPVGVVVPSVVVVTKELDPLDHRGDRVEVEPSEVTIADLQNPVSEIEQLEAVQECKRTKVN